MTWRKVQRAAVLQIHANESGRFWMATSIIRSYLAELQLRKGTGQVNVGSAPT